MGSFYQADGPVRLHWDTFCIRAQGGCKLAELLAYEVLTDIVGDIVSRLATVRSGLDRGLFWRLLKRLDCTVQSFVGLDWTVPKDRTVRYS